MFPALVLSDPAAASLGGPDLSRYFLVCGLLVACIAILGLAFRGLFARTLKLRAAKRSLQVVDVLPLGGKQRLVVVRCYDRVFLLGQGDKELTRLAELHGDEITPSDTIRPNAAIEEPAKTVRPSTREPRPTQAPAFGAELEQAFEKPVRDVAPRPPRQTVLDDGRGIIG